MRLEPLRFKPKERHGLRSKKDSDLKERLHLNRLDSKEKDVKLRSELKLRPKEKREKLNSNNGESRENKPLKLRGWSKKS